MVKEERRRFPRIKDEGLSLEVKLGDFDTITHTLNISASGIYCKLNKEIPLMSRVRLVLVLPGRRLEVDGVVVREHPVIIDGQTKHYDVAIFFDNLNEKDRETIADYVSQRRT